MSVLKPEQGLCEELNPHLRAAGWVVQNRSDLNLHAGSPVVLTPARPAIPYASEGLAGRLVVQDSHGAPARNLLTCMRHERAARLGEP